MLAIELVAVAIGVPVVMGLFYCLADHFFGDDGEW